MASNDVYLRKAPYTIIVPKGSRHNGEFSLIAENAPPLVLIVKPGRDETAKEIGVDLAIGSHFFMSCKYAPANDLRAKVREFAIGSDRELFHDLNADGKWDMRVLVDNERDRIKARAQIWYRGEWCDTTRGGLPVPLFRKLQGGPEVLFDMKKGLWVPREATRDDGTRKVAEKEQSLEERKRGEEKGTAISTGRADQGSVEKGARETSSQAPRARKGDPATKTLLASNVVYLSKPPYTIFVPKGARHKGDFSLLVEAAPLLVLTVTPSHDEAAKEIDTEKEILLSIGSDFSMSCKYSPDKELAAKVREFAFSNDRDYFIDLNADGKWDMRTLSYLDRTKARLQIWYQGEWRDAAQGDRHGRYFKKLQGGPAVWFDTKNGVWVPDERAGQSRKGK